MSGLLQLAREARALGDVPAPPERCEMCSAPVSTVHDHVVDVEDRRLCCACRSCALLFEHSGVAGGRYRTVSDRVLVAESFVPATAWAALRIPVSLSFVFFNSSLQRWVAIYPSAAGAVESEPDHRALAEMRSMTPLVDLVRPDIEALLARGRAGSAHVDLLLVSISAGYELVGRVRRRWRGFDGGDGARREIDAFLSGLLARSRLVSSRPGASP